MRHIQKAFEKYISPNVDRASDLKPARFWYTLILIVADIFDDENLIRRNFELLFSAATDTGGDINQQLGDTLLILWGVPLPAPDVHSQMTDFVQRIVALELPIRAIVGAADGCYGTVGTERRRNVTAFSSQLMDDLSRIRTLQGTGIFTRGDIGEELRQRGFDRFQDL